MNKNNPFAKAKGIKEKRKILKALSKGAKISAKMMGVTTNDVLIENYSDKNHQEFHSFMDWKEKGFVVKKGAKAFCVWSSPIERKAKKGKDEKGKKTKKETKYFGIAHLFSNYQVKKDKK